MPHNDLSHFLACLRFPKFGSKRMGKLARAFDNWGEVWSAGAQELTASGLHPNIVREFIATRPTISPEQERARFEASGLKIARITDDAYPQLLKHIHTPPVALFYQGNLPNPARPMLAVVGSRKITPYGKRVLEKFLPPLIESGVQIISGLALGVDGLAHQITTMRNGATFGVLPGGADTPSIAPRHHTQLARTMIASGGGVMSEFPIGTMALKQHFPVRNRLIAGMCQATLVIEAAARSGSLITARLAMEEGRDVLAVPGPIDSEVSEGTNRIIKDGATPATSVKDIFEVLSVIPETVDIAPPEPANITEAALFKVLRRTPKHLDDIAKESGLSIPILLETITALELRDVLVHTGGNNYRFR